ncbi:protein-lysine N-methyltransferase EEF2KMT isoform X2 [Salarias fasciatus]|uniref:protein-lysine N-methyltransferase EEF2KMT isoform X2 n=1 Tax=Salarias fasciatus TaxID=181472 RepID=UPI001176D04C|nr:protein-lysine N-methyltransferase EEF2KMT isoform X2 [Salarias fasciatus]
MEAREAAAEADGAVAEPDVLTDFQRWFFTMSRLKSFNWKFVENDLQRNKSSEIISEILKQTCLHPLCRSFPPSVRYRRLFLSELIRLEAAGCDPLDELYDALGEVVGEAEGSECYKSYFLPCGGAVSLLEKVALISEGTTGLVTWEAALYLAEWALDHREFFSDRTVLELGSGVGLTGVAICRSCRPRRFVFSDCHAAVLQALRDNVRLNGLDGRAAPAVSVRRLDWTTATEDELREVGADVVIAADVVYDPDVAHSLVELLRLVLTRSSPPPAVLVCCAVRNPQTYGGFRRQLESRGIQPEVLDGAVSHVFPYDRLSHMELIRLTAADGLQV